MPRWADCAAPSSLSLTMVGRAGSSSSESRPIPWSSAILQTVQPSTSPPITLRRFASAPKARTLAATNAALPKRSSLWFKRNTGIGASGEMRSTVPQRYRSRTTSPTTRSFSGFTAGTLMLTLVIIRPYPYWIYSDLFDVTECGYDVSARVAITPHHFLMGIIWRKPDFQYETLYGSLHCDAFVFAMLHPRGPKGAGPRVRP